GAGAPGLGRAHRGPADGARAPQGRLGAPRGRAAAQMDRHRQPLSQDEARGAGARAATHAGLGEAQPRAAPPGARELQAHRQGAAGKARAAARRLGGIPGAAAGTTPKPRPLVQPAGGEEAPVSVATPGLPRRLASMVYEAILLFAVAFFAAWIFFFASGGRDATAGGMRHLLQLFI